MPVSEQGQRLRRDVIWNLVPVVLLGVVGLGLSLVIADWWGAEAYGVFNLVTILLFVFAVIGACGLQFAVLRAVAEAPDDRDRVASVVAGALIPNLGLAAIATLAFLALRGPVSRLQGNPAVGEGMLWAAPGLFAFAVNKVLLGVVNGLRRMRAFAIYTSLRYLLIAAGLVLARVEHITSDHLAAIWTFSEGILLVILIVELLATVRLTRGAGWLVWARRHLDYGVRGVIATLGYEINSKLDVWMLGAITTNRELVGIYSLAAAFNEGVMQLAVVVQNNLNPVIARDLADGKRATVEELVRRTRRWFVPALVVACALAAVLYPVIIPWLLGDHKYAAGGVPFAILMTGVVLASPYLPFNQLLLMGMRPGWHTVFIVCVVAINFIGTLILIPLIGLAGAATATATGIVASAILLRTLVRSRVGVKI